MPRLEKWVTCALNPFMPDMYLMGYVFNDEKNRFDDGALIHTSTIVELNLEERYALTRSGSRYELGEKLVDTHYESEWYDGE